MPQKRVPSTQNSMNIQRSQRTISYQQNQNAQDYRDQNALWCKQEQNQRKQQLQQQQQQQTSDFISHMIFLQGFLKQQNGTNQIKKTN